MSISTTLFGEILHANLFFKPKVHYAIWSKTCSKPAGDLLASKFQTCVRMRNSVVIVSLRPKSTMLASQKTEDLFASMNPIDLT